jgi:hypothetical protein
MSTKRGGSKKSRKGKAKKGRKGTHKRASHKRKKKGARRGSVHVGAAHVLHFGDLTARKVKSKKRLPKHAKCVRNGKDPVTKKHYFEVRKKTGKALVNSIAAEQRRQNREYLKKHPAYGPAAPSAAELKRRREEAEYAAVMRGAACSGRDMD